MAFERRANSATCLACNRWGGARQTNSARDVAICNSQFDKGACLGGVWEGYTKTADSTCAKFTPWGVLK